MVAIATSRPLLLWQRRRTRRLIIQALFLAFVALVVLYLVSRALQLQFGFEFLRDRAGFAISHQWATTYIPNQSRFDAYLTGVWNTVRLVLTGLALATLLGVLAGVSRLSKNWLVARIAAVYVEIFRNTPLLVQIIFWYTAVLLQLPRASNGISVFDSFFLSNRALGVPWAYPAGAFVPWLLVVLGALVAAWFVRRMRLQYEDRTGMVGYGNRLALATFTAITLVSFLLLGRPLRYEAPFLDSAAGGVAVLAGGMQITPEFAALLLALVIYTGAYIAEVVRGSIQSLPPGQTEAAMALGLSGYQRITLIILPQALRTMIPPLTNQYLNLTKNSSLAVAIGYPDLVFVARTIQNNAGHAIPMFLIVMATYLALSFVIAALMNFLNRRVQLVER
jgi:general L-amino acid transport system permease protein